MVAALLLAAASYRFVERPMRRDGIWRSLRTAAASFFSQSFKLGHRVATLAVVAVLAVAVLGWVTAPSKSALQRQIDKSREIAQKSQQTRPPAASASARPSASASKHAPQPVDCSEVTAVGDSLMLASAVALREQLPGVYIDAEESRSMVVVPDIVASLKANGELRSHILIGVGDNGGVSAYMLQRIHDIAGPHREIVLITTAVPRSWRDSANVAMKEFAAEHDNVTTMRWDRKVDKRPELIGPDGVHPYGRGTRVYARQADKALRRA